MSTIRWILLVLFILVVVVTAVDFYWWGLRGDFKRAWQRRKAKRNG